MSLFNTMRTATSGMSAQSNALSVVGDNIANASTTGYKDASAQFETLLGINATSQYESGGVQTDVRYGVTDQGTLTATSSVTDLAVSGNGYFIVSKNGSGSYMTRAGSFVPDSNGNLVNAAGYQLMGYPETTNGTSTNLSVVNVSSTTLQAAASTTGTLQVNLPSTASAISDPNGNSLPADNSATSQYTDKTSMTVYDDLGNADVLDVYYAKTGANQWQVSAFQQSAAASGGGFPYSSGPIGTGTMSFDPTSGNLSSGSTLTLAVPNSGGAAANNVVVDMSATTQLSSAFATTTASANGNAPSRLDHISIGTDGTLSAVYASGTTVAKYKIPLASVTSPDNLTPLSGNVYQVSQNSGSMVVSSANSSGMGTIQSGELEQSTVDIATELTNMIQYQRGYEANSKVLQVGSDMLNTLEQLNFN